MHPIEYSNWDALTNVLSNYFAFKTGKKVPMEHLYPRTISPYTQSDDSIEATLKRAFGVE